MNKDRMIKLASFIPLFLLSAPSWSVYGLEKVRYATAFKGPEYIMMALAAQEKGLWEKNGLAVEWYSMEGGAPTFQALAAGSIEMGASQAVSVVQAVTRGVPAVMVGDMGFIEDWTLWVRQDSPIKEMRDLKGGKVGISRFGGAAYAFTLVFLKGAGLAKDVKMVAVGGPASRMSALKSGAIDGFFLTLSPVANLQAAGEIRSLGSLMEFLPQPWIGVVFFAGKKYLEEQSQMTKRFLKGALEATQFVLQNRAWTISRLVTHTRFTEPAARMVYDILHYSKDGKINPKALENVIAFLVEYQIVGKDKVPGLSKLYAPGIAE